MYCRAIIRPIPGTPRTPEISAVSGLIDMFIPIKPPTRFTAASIKPPKTLFMPSLKTHFSGLIKIQHKRYTSISPTAYAMMDIPSNSIKNHSPARRAAGVGRRRTLKYGICTILYGTCLFYDRIVKFVFSDNPMSAENRPPKTEIRIFSVYFRGLFKTAEYFFTINAGL